MFLLCLDGDEEAIRKQLAVSYIGASQRKTAKQTTEDELSSISSDGDGYLFPMQDADTKSLEELRLSRTKMDTIKELYNRLDKVAVLRQLCRLNDLFLYHLLVFCSLCTILLHLH